MTQYDIPINQSINDFNGIAADMLDFYSKPVFNVENLTNSQLSYH